MVAAVGPAAPDGEFERGNQAICQEEGPQELGADLVMATRADQAAARKEQCRPGDCIRRSEHASTIDDIANHRLIDMAVNVVIPAMGNGGSTAAGESDGDGGRHQQASHILTQNGSRHPQLSLCPVSNGAQPDDSASEAEWPSH